MQNISENIWLLQYPLHLLGANWGRNVTVIRLKSDQLFIHSTGPFTAQDATLVTSLGRLGWLVEPSSLHDTFTKQGRSTFPQVPFYATEAMRKQLDFPSESLANPPLEWAEELHWTRIGGTTAFEEYAFMHKPSRTLILCDLVFNFGEESGIWTHLMANCAVGTHHNPGMSRAVRLLAREKEEFETSLNTVLQWDFDRIIPAHHDVIETNAKERIREAFSRAGYSVA